MFNYEKRLQYPVKIKNPNPQLAKIIITQYGGPFRNLLQFHINKSLKAFITKPDSMFHNIYPVIILFIFLLYNCFCEV